jgi:hypothetical protein
MAVESDKIKNKTGIRAIPRGMAFFSCLSIETISGTNKGKSF